MTPARPSVFDLPARLHAKADATLIGDDERHFAAIAASLDDTVADLTARLNAARRSAGGSGTKAMERDEEIHRLTARLRTLGRYGVDLCLGHLVPADGGPTVYVGRLGLTDRDGQRLLVDWRSPAAAPFFAATHADPMGLARRRRYRWTRGRVTDYWDEVYVEGYGGPLGRVALDDQSAFVASLGASRTPHMRDVLATIAADQDAIVRAASSGALVVDGGPGTGKTVVALHRAAYLLYADPRLRGRRGGVLVIGPHQPYLDFVADVLPGLGEDSVQLCTLRDLVPEAATAGPEADPAVAGLKASARWADAIDRAVAVYEEPPVATTVVETEWGTFRVPPADWASAFEAPEPGTPHNEARTTVHDALVELLIEQHRGEEPTEPVRAAVARDHTLRQALERAWPLLDATDVVADLWSVPAYLRLAAPWLSPDERAVLRRPADAAWTDVDVPLLDLARRRLGDRSADGREQRNRATLAAERAVMDDVVEQLVAADDSELRVMSMLRRPDGDDEHPPLVGMTNLVDESRLEAADTDVLAGPFAHIIVDEAQELTDAEWQMVRQRCPSGSLTVVGDRAQARGGFAESWPDRLSRVGIDHTHLMSLTVNYRTPAEVMAVAEPVIRTVLPDANVPTSVRASGVPVRYAAVDERDRILDEWARTHADGIGVVIGDRRFAGTDRVRSLSPVHAKGLEFDLVVLVEDGAFGSGVEGAVDRYVAMTRATGRLVVLRPR